MLKTSLLLLTFGGAMIWAQDAAPSSSDETGRADAYYHYAMAHLYSELSFASPGNQQAYLDKARENYAEALKADPHAPPLVINPLHPVIAPPKPVPAPPNPSPSAGQK